MYVHQPATSQSMAANGGCHITKGAASRPSRKSKSPAPNKKLPPNAKKSANSKPSSPISPVAAKSSNNKSAQLQNKSVRSNNNHNVPAASSTSKSVQKQPAQFQISAKATKPAMNGAPPTHSAAAAPAHSAMASAMPLAAPQKMSTYYMPQKPMSVGVGYNHHHHHDDYKQAVMANANQQKASEAANKEKYRVKNRPAQYSIADKLLAQQNVEELEKMAEEEEERELKLKAKQMGSAPLQSASTYKYKK